MELQHLNSPHWKEVFNQYDINKNGKISISELKRLIESREYKNDIPDHVVKTIFKKADTNGDNELDFDEFMLMINDPKNHYFFSHLVERYKQYVKFILPPKPPAPDTHTVDGAYEDEYSCWPPAVFMILVSLVEIVIFCVDLGLGHDASAITGPVSNSLLYDPHRRREFWRYITYMFVHVGTFHLIVNVFVQIMLGTPLEMVHKGWRVILVYLAGVAAGSLGTSITDPTVKLAGASGGVYSLITAHLATIIMNWSEMSFGLIQLLFILIVITCDVGTAIYDRYVLNLDQQIGYAAHFFGALAGLLVGITVLRNIEVKRPEKILRWAALVIYILLMGTAIIWNIFYTSHFPMEFY